MNNRGLIQTIFLLLHNFELAILILNAWSVTESVMSATKSVFVLTSLTETTLDKNFFFKGTYISYKNRSFLFKNTEESNKINFV